MRMDNCMRPGGRLPQARDKIGVKFRLRLALLQLCPRDRDNACSRWLGPGFPSPPLLSVMHSLSRWRDCPRIMHFVPRCNCGGPILLTQHFCLEDLFDGEQVAA